LKPDGPELFHGLGRALFELSAAEEAHDAFQRDYTLTRKASSWFMAATVVPIVPRNAEQIAEARARCAAALAAPPAVRPAGPDDLPTILPNFYWAYHNERDLPLQRHLSEWLRATYPCLTAEAPHVRGVQPREGRRLRVGFVSPNFTDHTIGLLFADTITQLPRDRLDVVVFAVPAPGSEVQKRLRENVEKLVVLPGSLIDAQRVIGAEKCDVLVYPDIGMSALTYFLAFARLAPVQCLSWGHPNSPGIDTLDAFLSCGAMEPEDGNEHYRERLVRLSRLGLYYRRPELTCATLTRQQLGLPEEANLYVCPQTPFKFHPDFDSVLRRILARDANGRLILISHTNPTADRLLFQRLTDGGIDAKQVIFTARLPRTAFISLMAVSDVMLDPLHYSGGNTSLEALAFGTPIVTLAGRFMRNRHTAGLYEIMGMGDAVSQTIEEYIDRAAEVATNKVLQGQMRRRILEANSVLFEDVACGAEWADAFEELFDSQGRGK
jgi:protein O-GlcNAc transferase